MLRYHFSIKVTGLKSFTVHLESNELRFKEHFVFNQQNKVPWFFSFLDSLKIPCIKRNNLRFVLGFNELQILANPQLNAFLLRNYIVEIQSKGPLSAFKKCLKCIGVGRPLCHNIDTKVRGEQSIDIQGEGSKKRGDVGRERQQMNGKIMIQDQR